MQALQKDKNKEFIQAFGRVLAKLHTESKRSARSIAYEINMSKTTLLLAENGKLDPQITTFCKIAEAFYLKPENLLQMIYKELPENWSIIEDLSDTIGEICRVVKKKNPDCICFVDNCYGEFVEAKEPLEAGADIIAGSLIKNPGGGIVEAGGYIAGKARLVDRAANRLTAPGIGAEGGAMFNQHRLIFQGLFMAPSVVSEAVKGAVLAAKIFDEIGYNSSPKFNEKRTDIIQNITFNSPEPLEQFCRTIQSLSPVNGYVTPIPEYIPGYEDKVIMAGGTFIEGSTIELSADGPMRAPYVAYMQGGLNYAHVKIALTKILEKVMK